jgi:hypothetical protein
MDEWNCVGVVSDSSPIAFGGIDNVWTHKWIRIPDAVAEVVDPHYQQARRFAVYEITVDGNAVRFAAGEFSNCVWGFYLPIPRPADEANRG